MEEPELHWKETADDIIESIIENLYETVGESGVRDFEVSEYACEDLQRRINSEIRDWLKQFGIKSPVPEVRKQNEYKK